MPPENLKIAEVRKDRVKISWSAPESDGGAMIKNYVIEKRDTSKMAWIACGNVDSQTFDFTVRATHVCVCVCLSVCLSVPCRQ